MCEKLRIQRQADSGLPFLLRGALKMPESLSGGEYLAACFGEERRKFNVTGKKLLP